MASDKSVSSICLLIIFAALAIVGGRIAVVRSSTGEVPFLSANDRSRWATVASLVDYGTYRIDHFQQIRDPKTNRRTWQSIDRVRHLGSDGKMHDYSSKPPLLATMVAGVYWIVRTVTGAGIQVNTFYVTRFILILVNLPLLAIMFACVKSLAWRYATTDFARVFAVLSICLGTLLTSFAVSLNNHLPAAVASIVALWMLDTQARHKASLGKMFLAGAAVAFSVANELPSLAILPLWGLISLRLSISKTLLGFVPGICVVAAAFFGTNWVAHQSLRPPYAHRGVGGLLESIPLVPSDSSRSTPGDNLELAWKYKDKIAAAVGVEWNELGIERARNDKWLRAKTSKSPQIYALVVADSEIEIRQWDDWYDYSGTYWVKEKLTGVDLGETNQWNYAFHVLVGHYGIFSLTPIWLLSVMGTGIWFFERRSLPNEFAATSRMLGFPWIAAVVIGLVSLVVLAFYLSRPQIDRNYGGVSSGLRWMFWLAPLWVYLSLPAVDWLAKSKWGRAVCGVLLASSCFTVATSLENPWTHPWLYQLLQAFGG